MFHVLLLVLGLHGVLVLGGESGFIIGGQDVDRPGKYPWIGSLERKPLDIIGGDFSHLCGCSYVGGSFVVTAAHCLTGTTTQRLRVLLGTHDRNDTESGGQPEYFYVAKYTVHPGWIYRWPLGYPNDVAVIEMDGVPDPSNPYIQAIPVPPPGRTEDDFMAMDCVISGWGLTEGNGTDLPVILQEVEIDVISQAECKERWVEYATISEMHVCLMDTENQEKASCGGDSGSPLVCRADEADDYELVGITSWGYWECDPSFPSVYGKVSYHSDWINGVIANSTML